MSKNQKALVPEQVCQTWEVMCWVFDKKYYEFLVSLFLLTSCFLFLFVCFFFFLRQGLSMYHRLALNSNSSVESPKCWDLDMCHHAPALYCLPCFFLSQGRFWTLGFFPPFFPPDSLVLWLNDLYKLLFIRNTISQLESKFLEAGLICTLQSSCLNRVI
jgi:hypothetical protein